MLAALAQLTPFGRRHAATTLEGVPWYPVVGLLLGLTVGTLWWLAAKGWPVGVAAALALLADLGLTGWRHLSGLARSSRRERVALAIAPAVLLVRWTALASLRPSIVLVGGIWCASRAWLAALSGVDPSGWGTESLAGDEAHDDPEGPDPDGPDLEGPAGATGPVAWAGSGLGLRSWSVALLGVSAGIAVASIWHGVAGPVSILAGTVVTAGAGLVMAQRGTPLAGDVLSAICVMGETAALVVAAARW